MILQLGKSREEYMRDCRQKKCKEKLKTGRVEPKQITHNSTHFRTRAANSIVSRTSTADPTTALFSGYNINSAYHQGDMTIITRQMRLVLFLGIW